MHSGNSAAFSEQDLSYLVLIGNLIALAIILFEPRA